jgi:hypothetical protein
MAAVVLAVHLLLETGAPVFFFLFFLLLLLPPQLFMM